MTCACAQLISSGKPIPRTAKPPVIFVDGYQTSCTSNQFADNFGQFDQILQSAGRVSLFFDNCAFSGKPTIEELGSNFRDYLAALKYNDNSAVNQVDVVAHSMGGLVLRAYLSGKIAAGGFRPPDAVTIRKAVFLATPHFGSPIASLFGTDAQATELALGSLFVFDLGTWNQGTDDLRGIDALALAGNGGTGLAIQKGYDDGVVSLSSASIGFVTPGRTRVIPYCHTPPGIVTTFGVCPPGAPGIAQGVNATDANAAAVLSFLGDTNDWQNIGTAAEKDPLLSTNGGLILRVKSPDDRYLSIQSASASKQLNLQGNDVAYTEALAAQQQTVNITTASGSFSSTFTLPAGYVTAVGLKTGPIISRVLPSAAALTPLAVAPGMFVAIYGASLAPVTMQAPSQPYPTTLGGVQVSFNGTPAGLQFVSPGQINAIVPVSAQGLVKVTVTNGPGSHSVNVLVQPAVPALFTTNQSGSGPAAALNAVTNTLVTADSRLRPGDYVALYLTGLGTVHASGGLQVADVPPTVTVGGKPCTVTFAGRAPGFDGLDQINCRIDASLMPDPTSPVQVVSGSRTSNLATLAIGM